jgi:hypothetical protein
LELKYIKKADKKKKEAQSELKLVDKITNEARQQLKDYLKSDNAKRLEGLKAWLLVLVGREWHLIEEITE